MKNRLLTLVAAAVTLASAAFAAPSTYYINNAPVTTLDIPPQIDADIFINRSIFDVFTTLPYTMQNVRVATNNGTMSGTPGYDFQNFTDGRRLRGKKSLRNSKQLIVPASWFVNNGNISGASLVNVNATNVISSGRLDSTEGGFIRINSSGRADLSRGGVRVGPTLDPTLNCGFVSVSSNFTADGNILDLYWGGGRNNAIGTNGRPLNLASINSFTNFGLANFSLPFPQSPTHEVIQRSGSFLFTNTTFVPGGFLGIGGCGNGYGAFVHTNVDGNDLVINVVFVATNSAISPSNLFVDVSFLPNSGPAGIAYAPVVEFRNVDFDIVNQDFVTNYVTFVDASAAYTNIVLARPLGGGVGATRSTRRPWTYTWIRGRLCEATFPGFLETTNAGFSPTMFYNPVLFATNTVNTIYAADSVQIGQSNSSFFATGLTPQTVTVNGVVRQLGVNPGLSDPTNFAGNATIFAKNLSLAGTRIRSEDFIGIHTDNLVSNVAAQIDAPFIDFDVRTTESKLVISNVAPAFVNRLQGTISAWSSVWSVNVTNANSTNTHSERYHVVILDNCLRSEQPVTINRFIAHGTNLVVEDNLFINSGVLLDAQSLTIGTNGGINLPTPANLTFTNVLNLLTFTNYGVLNVPGSAQLGISLAGHISTNAPPPKRPIRRNRKPVVEKPVALDTFVNNGTITAASVLVRGTNVFNLGSGLSPAALNGSGGIIAVYGNDVVVSNGSLIATSDIEFHANHLKTASTFMSSGTTSNILGQFVRGSIIIQATNSFGDTDSVSTNDWFTTGGIQVPNRPTQMGDLMGTRIYALAAPLAVSTILWPGENRGSSADGYNHNLAVGRLVLDGRGANLFHFKSATGSNALYVDYLELLNDATNYNFAVGVDPDFTIYFADANVPPEKLDNVGGRIHWINTFTGPQSSTNLVYPGGTNHVFNAGLVRSLDIDSDGDGIVNGQDCTPLPVPELDSTLVNCPPPPLSKSQPKVQVLSSTDIHLNIALANGQAVLNWVAPANSANSVEWARALRGGTWQTLTNFITGPVDTRVSVRDAAGEPLRVYRVRVDAAKRP